MNEIYSKFVAERKNWLEKFNSATPEEQKRMLEEKKAKHEEEEKRRQKEIYDDRKNRFFKKCDEQIATYELLEKALPIALEISAKFDGKVLNNRLTKAVDDEIRAKVNQYVRAELIISYDYNLKNNVGKLSIIDYNHHDYEREISFKIILSPLSDNNRVMWKETLEYMEKPEGKTIDIAERISERKNAKKNYDRIYKKAKKVDEIIAEYAKEDFYVRDFFKSEHVIGGTYYL